MFTDEITVDARGHRCPVPTLRLRRALEDASPGVKVRLLADDPLAAAFGDQLERVKPTPQVLEWERIAQEMRLVTEQVVRGGLVQDAAVERLDARVDDILAKRRWIVEQRAQKEAVQ